MTMADMKCDVCETSEPIGVAGTAEAISVAYCRECAIRYAQPAVVFELWFDLFGTDFDKMCDAARNLKTYKDGEYVGYEKWALWRAQQPGEKNG